MILEFLVESNIHSDVSFAKEVLENEELTNRIDILCVDGGYYSEDIVIKAEEKNITVNFSQMTGTKPTEDKLGAHEYKFNNNVCTCPNNKQSIIIKTNEETGVQIAYFLKPDCEGCLLKEKCICSVGKDYDIVRVTTKKRCADETKVKIGTEEHRKFANFRAGVEGIPSLLRRTYRVDEIPTRGLVYKKIWFSAKFMASNLKQIRKYLAASLEAESFFISMKFKWIQMEKNYFIS